MNLDLKKASREELVDVCLSFQNSVSFLEKTVKKLESSNSHLEYKLEWCLRQIFGRKSEKLIPQYATQLNFLEVPETPPEIKTTVKEYERTSRENKTESDNEQKLRFDDSVPVVENVVFPDEVKNSDIKHLLKQPFLQYEKTTLSANLED